MPDVISVRVVSVSGKICTAIVVALAAAGCGADRTAEDADTSTSTITTATTTTPAPTTTSTTIPPPTSTTTTSTTTTSTTSTSTSTSTTTVPAGRAAIEACLPGATALDLVGLLVWPAVFPDDIDATRERVAELGLGGVLLMEPTGLDTDTLTARIAELEEASRVGLVVATDEEGGTVQRLRAIEPLPSQRSISESQPPVEARATIEAHGVIVADIGVDLVLGPVVDVLPAEGAPPLSGSRFFAGGPEDVAAYGRAYIDGWRAAGVEPVLKHFPGHGGASGDTHDVPGVVAPIDELAGRDLVPYRELAPAQPAVMVGHLTVPGLTDGEPASVSPAAVEYLRSIDGYDDALVISDALEMSAVGRPVPDAAVASIAAGVDVVLFTTASLTGEVVDALEAAVRAGEIEPDRIESAAARVLRLLPCS